MIIKWEVEDGYVSGSRPHILEIPDEDLEGLSDKEKNELIEDCVQEEFEQTITYSWKIQE